MALRTVVRMVLAVLALGPVAAAHGRDPATPWRGVHLMAPGHDDVPLLKRAVAEGLAPLGVNTLVLEVNYNYRYRSHPDLGTSWGLTRDDARALADVCRAHGVRLIPMFNCLGHQSWARNTLPLLKRHPEFDETPGVPADNRGIYCRSWCPLHPGVNAVVFALLDELVEAFDADAFHVGMDEVFLIADPRCPRCRGKDPAELFARAVNDYHRHLVGDRKLTMLMWADRLIDARAMDYGKWEASANGTAAAVDRIPKDVVLCDWHYEPRASYPSVHSFQEKGFRVWPASWKDERAALALRDDARRGATDRMVGHLGTTWAGADGVCRALLGEPGPVPDSARQAVAALRACLAPPDRPPARERPGSKPGGRPPDGPADRPATPDRVGKPSPTFTPARRPTTFE